MIDAILGTACPLGFAIMCLLIIILVTPKLIDALFYIRQELLERETQETISVEQYKKPKL
jgi:hypothetical protein